MKSVTARRPEGLANRRAGVASTTIRYLGALAFFAACVALWLLPLTSHLGSSILGAPHDATSAIRTFWSMEAQ